MEFLEILGPKDAFLKGLNLLTIPLDLPVITCNISFSYTQNCWRYGSIFTYIVHGYRETLFYDKLQTSSLELNHVNAVYIVKGLQQNINKTGSIYTSTIANINAFNE